MQTSPYSSEQEEELFETDKLLIEGIPIHTSEECLIHGKMKIIVTTTTKTEHMIPLSYKMYLPSNLQVMEILPHENVEKLRRLLVENTRSVTAIKSGSHYKNFVRGTIATFSESKITRFKKVKDKPSTQTTFADRLINKKFPCYVSAFANYAGGYMYVGIDEEGKVEGEFLTEEEKRKSKEIDSQSD